MPTQLSPNFRKEAINYMNKNWLILGLTMISILVDSPMSANAGNSASRVLSEGSCRIYTPLKWGNRLHEELDSILLEKGYEIIHFPANPPAESFFIPPTLPPDSIPNGDLYLDIDYTVEFRVIDLFPRHFVQCEAVAEILRKTENEQFATVARKNKNGIEYDPRRLGDCSKSLKNAVKSLPDCH
jgi:hypothetical protein